MPYKDPEKQKAATAAWRAARRQGKKRVLMPSTCALCNKVTIARSLCEHHYRRSRADGTLDLYPPSRPRVTQWKEQPCKGNNCPRIAVRLGFCHTHYMRVYKYGDPAANHKHDGWAGTQVVVGPGLSYILGVVKGDGSCFRRSEGSYRIRLQVKDREFADSFVEALKRLGLKGRLYRTNRNQWSVNSDSKQVFQALNTGTWRRIAEAYPIEFIRGFYESEGSASVNTKGALNITLTNTDDDLLTWLIPMFAQLGWRVSLHISTRAGVYFNKTWARRTGNGWYKRKTCYRLYLHGTNTSKMNFLQQIAPCIKWPKKEVTYGKKVL